jgi:hypothetical protein
VSDPKADPLDEGLRLIEKAIGVVGLSEEHLLHAMDTLSEREAASFPCGLA